MALSIAGRSEVYDISVDDAEFFADGILVHNCSDTLRYAVVDLLRSQFTEFSMGRKRSLYNESEFKFFNPSTEYEYDTTMVYVLPNFGGVFSLVRIGKVGDRWHLTDVCCRTVKGNDEIVSAVTEMSADRYVVECQQAYFPMVRELRAALGDVAVVKMGSDHRTRIAATSDWIRAHVHIDPERMNEQEYGRFVNDMLDYNDESPAEVAVASASLSGAARVIIRNGI